MENISFPNYFLVASINRFFDSRSSILYVKIAEMGCISITCRLQRDIFSALSNKSRSFSPASAF